MNVRLAMILVPLLISPARASHDPARTATIVVGGFEQDGFQEGGVFGDVAVDSLLDDIASLAGLPTSNDPANLVLPDVVTTTEYYGDTAPAYYDAQDQAELAQVTAAWGGGVPRYALIVAKFARHVMEVSGAAQVNFVSASFGSLIVRWLVEKNVEGLAGEGKVARWMSAEGLLAGSWPASQPDLVDLYELVQAPSIDVEHMKYEWVRANLHDPRTAIDDSDYSKILLGTFGSTDDHLNGGALTAAMLAVGDFQANDGVQGLEDTHFHETAPQSRLEGLLPLRSSYHTDHYGLESHRGAWAQLALFLTGSRRVTITMTRAQVGDIHENIFLRPAEIVFESSVRSPTVEAWGIAEPVSEQEFEGAALPIRSFGGNGQTKYFQQVLFDGIVAPQETALQLRIGATEIDLELRYGVAETVVQPFLTDLGSASVTVPILQPATHLCQAANWNCDLAVTIYSYGFDVPTDSSRPPPLASSGLHVFPNPSRAGVTISFAGIEAPSSGAPATLWIFDVAGRIVRRIEGTAGRPFVWDGRGANERLVPGGVYLYELRTEAGAARGRGALLR